MGCIRILFSPVAALLGAVAMTVVALAGFAIALAALGAPASYRGDSWMASDTLLAILLGITFVATITGGAVARRMGGGGHPSAGKGGKMPADAVHFMDGGAGGQQRLIHRNQIIQRQARRRERR